MMILNIEKHEEDYIFSPSHKDIGAWGIIQYFKEAWGRSYISDSYGNCFSIYEVDEEDLYEQGEFVVYKDIEAKKKWDDEGYSLENSKTAVLVIFDNNQIHFTYNDSELSYKLIKEICRTILINHVASNSSRPERVRLC